MFYFKQEEKSKALQSKNIEKIKNIEWLHGPVVKVEEHKKKYRRTYKNLKFAVADGVIDWKIKATCKKFNWINIKEGVR